MKNILLFFLVTSLCTIAQSQSELFLRVNHQLDGKPFALNLEATSPMGTNYKLTRLQYYISGIKIIHDGAKEMNLNNVYLFVDPNNPNAKSFSLGILNGISNIEKIEFAIGVDIASNHLDPASYAASHPLAHKNPSMHWGWTSGYRFIALEGKAKRVSGQFLDDIAIHTVGNVNYKSKTYDVSSKIENGIMYIDMIAEYNMLLDAIIIAGGNSNHGESGSAAELCNNATFKVFSAATPSATNDVYNNALTQVVYTSGDVSVKYLFPSNSNLNFNLYDTKGMLIADSRIIQNEGIQAIDRQLPAGNYFYSFTQSGKVISTGKLIKK